jgi:hypothetical protein
VSNTDERCQIKGFVRETTDDPTAAALKKINKNTQESLGANDIHIFTAIPSTDALDSYFTRMTEGSLKNYAKDLKDGRALCDTHSRDQLPIGYSYNGEFNKELVLTEGNYYIQRDLNITGVNTDHIIRAIVGGTVRDVSIGFCPEWYRCSVCKKDISDWQACEHIPGLKYDGEMCFAWVENARLSETSLVYDGATPGAIIKKAIRAARDHMISPAEMCRLENNLAVRFPEDVSKATLIKKKVVRVGDVSSEESEEHI